MKGLGLGGLNNLVLDAAGILSVGWTEAYSAAGQDHLRVRPDRCAKI